METISPGYKALNAALHAENPNYGAHGHKMGAHVLPLIRKFGIKTVVDYGCGKGGLKEWLRRYSPAEVTNYDPCIQEFSARPAPADLVVCTDVMEHVEPTYTDCVLADIQKLAVKAVFFNISIREALKVLPDGRNAHINLKPAEGWFDAVRDYFDIVCYEVQPGHALTIVALPLVVHHA
jgi:methyltransferase family protein